MSGPEIITFGCRLNAYESEVMRDHAQAGGLDDAIVFNTCAVTAEATRQVEVGRGLIGIDLDGKSVTRGGSIMIAKSVEDDAVVVDGLRVFGV